MTEAISVLCVLAGIFVGIGLTLFAQRLQDEYYDERWEDDDDDM